MSWIDTSKGKTTTERGYGHAWRKRRERIKAKANGMCELCAANGLIVPGTDCDHKLPKSKGGTDEDENLQWICEECHKRKTQDDKGNLLAKGCTIDGIPLDSEHHWNK